MINAIFTKQRRQVTARCSSRLFVDGYIICHDLAMQKPARSKGVTSN